MADTADPPTPTPAAPLALRLIAGAWVLGVSWHAMMAVHELGHVFAAWWTGGTVERVVLPWLGFSRTDVMPNPQPLAVTWAGPIAGVVFPLVCWAFVQRTALRMGPPLRFFAGWCLICNGVYLGLGWIDRVGDAGDLLQLGATRWQLIAFGAASFALGLWLWHGLGRGLGLADASRKDCARLLVAAAFAGLLYAVAWFAVS